MVESENSTKTTDSEYNKIAALLTIIDDESLRIKLQTTIGSIKP